MWQEAQKMITLYRTDDRILSEIQEYGPGAWIVMTKPTIDESKSIAERFEIDLADVRAALDDEESSRVQVVDNYTLIIVDIPSIEIRNEREAYTTIPLGIILVADCIITICAEETPVLEAFMEGKVREFSTKKRMRFMYQILYRNCTTYQYYLRVMDRRRTLIEQRIQEETEDADLIDLHELESNLVPLMISLYICVISIACLFSTKTSSSSSLSSGYCLILPYLVSLSRTTPFALSDVAKYTRLDSNS